MIANQNQFKQMGFFNSLSTLSSRQIGWLTGSWAFLFRLFIYPLIDPRMFDELYSPEYSRPANPPQVIVSMLLIQQMYNKTDDEMHDWMMGGDIALRFATNTIGLPLDCIYSNDKQLSRFRARVTKYANEHNGRNLLDECIQNVNYGMWAMMGITLQNVRMDSTQIAANMAKMSRTSLVYSANWRILRDILKNDPSQKQVITDAGLDHYLQDYDANRVLYHSQTSIESKQLTLASEASSILDLYPETARNTDEWKLYLRILSEQTVVENGVRRFVSTKDGTLKATFVQNPVDPMATYREKANNKFIGYVLNFAEAVGVCGSQIVSWDLEQNVVQDPVMALTFLKEADAIVAGIREYCDILGIEHPNDMEKCQKTLQEKVKLVTDEINDAFGKGRRIPMSVELDPLHVQDEDNSGWETPADGQQLSMLEELLSGLGVCVQGKSKPNLEGETAADAAVESVEASDESSETVSDNGQSTTASVDSDSQSDSIPDSNDAGTKVEPISGVIVGSVISATESSDTTDASVVDDSQSSPASESHTETQESNRVPEDVTPDSSTAVEGTVQVFHDNQETKPEAAINPGSDSTGTKTDAASSENQQAESDKDGSSSDNKKEESAPKLVILNGKCFIDGIELTTYIKEHDFAALPSELRRQALLHLLRQNQQFHLGEIGNQNALVVDGAYSDEELQEQAAKMGFVILPTDLLGAKSNPVVGLFHFDDSRTSVISCPRNGQILEQVLEKTGKITLKMAPGACDNCPYRNDCKAEWQSRKMMWKVGVSPNAYSRVHTEAFMRGEDYNCIGQFRNGVETIPSILHNVMNVDGMPIGQVAKKAVLGLKVSALNIKKFFSFCSGKSTIRRNPILTRAFA